MKKIGIFYGSSTGVCDSIAEKIAEKLQVASSDVNTPDKISSMAANSDVLLLGSSTWGSGELQDDWYDGLDALKNVDLTGKTVAFFGCGDSSSFCDTFCDAMGLIYEGIKDKGCNFVGRVSTADYNFSSSVAVVDNEFIGLALDEVNEDYKTDDRINAWIESIRPSI